MNQKNHKRLNLYRVNMKYIRDLQRADNKVLSVSPQINKEKRVFIGTVVVNNNQLYLIPLSHAKPKHINMKSSADFEKIYDKNDTYSHHFGGGISILHSFILYDIFIS